MNKATPTLLSSKMVVASNDGTLLEVRGFGALKGRLQISEGLDLTKPIYEQVVQAKPSAGRRKA